MKPLPFAISLEAGSSLGNHTGSWRSERPVYVDRMPPCNHACPAGENVQAWLYAAEEGDYRTAWRALVEENPMPAVMGRVCFHPCETACNRAQLDEAVGINAVERFLGDEALRQGWELLPSPLAGSGRRILVVGAGPAGLSCAYHLRRLGHDVTLRDAAPDAGGMMRYGIPRYRLPRDVLDAEIARIIGLGVTLESGTRVDDLAEAMREGGFDAAFVAVGAQLGKQANIPAGDSARIVDAVTLLRSVEAGEPVYLGRRVAVYGGGDTAMDAARTARRLGSTDPLIVYRRTRERMPAHPEEVEEAEDEGVSMRWLSTVTAANRGHLRLERMELDGSGFPQPTGRFDDLAADTLVLALGQESDLHLLDSLGDVVSRDGLVEVGATLMTGHRGVFAGGDIIRGEQTVTEAVGHGKKAARAIDFLFRGVEYEQPEKHELAAYEMLNTWYYSDAPRQERGRLDVARRHTTFDEVVHGLDTGNALFEARRCMSCGNCFECDNCYGVCPDNAVTKLGPGQRFAFEYDWCKGCGICAAECPAGAIRMIPEEI